MTCEHYLETATEPACKGKGSFYIAQYPVRWAAQNALHFLPSLTDLFIPTPFSVSPGSILAMQPLRETTKSLTFPPLSIVRYSFIQLSQQGRQWREGKCPIFQTVAKGDSNPGSLDCESGILPLSYRAPHVTWCWRCLDAVCATSVMCCACPPTGWSDAH